MKEPYVSLEGLLDLCLKLNKASRPSDAYRRTGANEYFGYCGNFPYPSWFNRVVVHTIPAEEPARSEVLNEAVSLCKADGSPKRLSYCEEEVGPGTGSYLKACGMQCIATHSGMIYDYQTETEASLAAIRKAVPNVYVTEIGADMISEWTAVCNAAFRKEDPQKIYDRLFRSEGCKFYAVIEDGRIVSTGLLNVNSNGNNAGIHSVGTPAKYRGRGYATAIVARMMDDARAAGVSVLSIQATELGAPVYRKLGFRTIASIRTYIYP